MNGKSCYIDTSFFIDLFSESKTSSKHQKLISKFKNVYSSPLLVTEFFSYSKREKVDALFAESLIKKVAIVQMDSDFIEQSKIVLDQGYLRGADLYHLCSALFLDPECTHLYFLTLDKAQGVVAKKLGFKG